jgi:hypothetical protein
MLGMTHRAAHLKQVVSSEVVSGSSDVSRENLHWSRSPALFEEVLSFGADGPRWRARQRQSSFVSPIPQFRGCTLMSRCRITPWETRLDGQK